MSKLIGWRAENYLWVPIFEGDPNTKLQGVGPEWMQSADAFIERLKSAGWRAHADSQHDGARAMFNELKATA
ncbi:TPA: hypothetical protein ACLG1F_004330 [Pseudomonas aeruginosa]|nr:hypothetical protein [Pseudomonas aeruginosa]EKW5992849.1 hypothetical protein [Pseudomonas aeruginosa]EMB6065613.1 hypothetical protein [Pseudomonas aeruginosa]MBV5767804.1 hypothetical protein [Pseudomonas aeruginosa]MBV5995631.1 hypothetical protein [Pseudomonas aeruginosa]